MSYISAKDTGSVYVHTNMYILIMYHRVSTVVYIYLSVPGKRPWALKHNLRFWPAWALTRDINSVCLYGSCNSDPLEIQYMGAYLGVGACPGHYSIIRALKIVRKGEGESGNEANKLWPLQVCGTAIAVRVMMKLIHTPLLISLDSFYH